MSPNYHPLFTIPIPYGLVFWPIYLFFFLAEINTSRLKRADTASSTISRDSGTILVVSIALGICGAFLSVGVFPWATILHGAHPAFWLGCGLMLGGILFRRYAVYTLGKYFTYTVIVAGDQPVIETGPYRLIRHPSYTGALLTLLGLGLALTNWMSVVFLVVFPVFGYLYRVGKEEKALANVIGQSYREYMTRTKRFIPWVW